MIFVWVRSASLARARVRQRVASGGHHVPPEVIDRRYYRGIANFLNLYAPIADNWGAYDNSENEPILIAQGNSGTLQINEPKTWEQLAYQATL